MKSGAVNFVIHKIHSRNHPIMIAETLARMGYSHVEISETFIEVGKVTDKLHQELIAGNDFLPALNENLEDYFKEGNIKIFKKIITEVLPTSLKPKIHKTLFPYPAPAPVVVDLMRRSKNVAITRHVFVFRFLYALSMAVLGIVLAYVLIKSQSLSVISSTDPLNVVSPSMLIFISAVFIFIAYILQLFARRLHNAGMSPWLTLLLFTPLLATLTNLSQNDQKTLLFLSCIPITGVFIAATLLPTHRYKL